MPSLENVHRKKLKDAKTAFDYWFHWMIMMLERRRKTSDGPGVLRGLLADPNFYEKLDETKAGMRAKARWWSTDDDDAEYAYHQSAALSSAASQYASVRSAHEGEKTKNKSSSSDSKEPGDDEGDADGQGSPKRRKQAEDSDDMGDDCEHSGTDDDDDDDDGGGSGGGEGSATSGADSEHYKTLGLKHGCTLEQVKKAFRKLALKVHPDKHKGDKGAEEAFKKLSAAYEALQKSMPKGSAADPVDADDDGNTDESKADEAQFTSKSALAREMKAGLQSLYGADHKVSRSEALKYVVAAGLLPPRSVVKRRDLEFIYSATLQGFDISDDADLDFGGWWGRETALFDDYLEDAELDKNAPKDAAQVAALEALLKRSYYWLYRSERR